MGFYYFGKERKVYNENKDEKLRLETQMNLDEENKIEYWEKMHQLQNIMYENRKDKVDEQYEKEKKRIEFEARIKEEEKKKQLVTKTLELQRKKHEIIEQNKENKKQLQNSLLECSKTLREIQQSIKNTYMFIPCKQMCELLINIRQNIYENIEDIQEDFEDVIGAFGINEFKPLVGEVFDVKYHNQVYSNVSDARGRRIDKVYSSGFEMDGEIIVKANVSVEEEIIGGRYE